MVVYFTKITLRPEKLKCFYYYSRQIKLLSRQIKIKILKFIYIFYILFSLRMYRIWFIEHKWTMNFEKSSCRILLPLFPLFFFSYFNFISFSQFNFKTEISSVEWERSPILLKQRMCFKWDVFLVDRQCKTWPVFFIAWKFEFSEMNPFWNSPPLFKCNVTCWVLHYIWNCKPVLF